MTPPEESAAWTWTEFERALQAVETLRQSGATRAYAFNAAARPPLMEWAPLLMAQCGPLFPEEGTAGDAAKEIALAPRLADALARVADLRRRGLTAPTFGIDDAPAAQESFLSGNVAMLMSIPALLRRLETARFRWRIVAPPVGEWGEPITTGALAAFAVVDSGDAERITAAHRLARYLTSEAVARDVPGWYLAPPARRTIDTFYDMPPYDALQPVLPLASYLRPPSRPGFMEGVFVPQLQAGLMDEATPGGGVEEIRRAWRREALW